MASPGIVRGFPVPGPPGLGKPEVVTNASKPAPSARPVDSLIWVSDDNGGTLYRNLTTAAWTKMASGASEAGGGSELYFSEISSNQTVASGASTNLTVWPSITVTVTSRPIWIDVRMNITNASGGTAGAAIYEGATQLEGVSTTVTAGSSPPTMLRKRLAPTAGAHVYSVIVTKPSAGTHTINAAVPSFGVAGSYVRVTEG